MVKQLIELVLALLLTVLPFGNVLPAEQTEPAVTTAVVHSQMSDGAILARLENMLEHNHCFGDDFSESQALISAAAVSLKNQINDGLIPAAAVDAFVFNMYGKTLTGLSDDGFYAVSPLGYDVYEYTVNGFTYNGDGTLTADCTVILNPETDAQTMSATAVFFVDGTSAFGYNLISCEIF